MSCAVIVSTEDQDREGDVVIAQGGDLSNHQRNPVVLFEHGLTDLKMPIGSAQSPEGAYSVQVVPGMVKAMTYFARTAEGEQTYRLVEDGLLRGVSIGVRPVQQTFLPPSSEHPQGGVQLDRWELLEYSHVVLPMNPNALVLEALGKPYLKSLLLRGALERHAPPKTITATVPQGVPVATQPQTPPVTSTSPSTNPNTPPPVTKSADSGSRDYAPLNDQGQAQQTPPAPPPPDDMGDEAMDKLPPGAHALAGLHASLMCAAKHIADVSSKQENPAVQDLLDQHSQHLDDHMSEIEKMYSAHYPDAEPLVRGLSEDDYDSGAGLVNPEDADDKSASPGSRDEGKDLEGEEMHTYKRMKRWAARNQANTRLFKRMQLIRKRSQAEKVKLKRLSRSHAAVVAKAADHLGECANLGGQLFSPTHASASAYHAGSLKTLACPPGSSEEGEDLEGNSQEFVKSATVRIESLTATVLKLQRQLQRALQGHRS